MTKKKVEVNEDILKNIISGIFLSSAGRSP